MRVHFLFSVTVLAMLAAQTPRADTCSGAPGTLDPCFGSGGLYAHDLLGGHDVSWDLAVQPDGKIVVVGGTRAANESVYRFSVVRYRADGSGLDSSFGGTGFVRTTFASTKNEEIAYRVALQPDGRIVVLGRAKISSKGNAKDGFAVARYLTNGTLDSSFGIGGKVVIPLGSGSVSPEGLALQGNKIVIGGRCGNAAVFARLNANGSVDIAFGPGGSTTPVSNAIVSIKDIAIDGSGRIVVAGGLNGDVLVLRLTANGTLDTTFDGDGKAITDVAGYYDFAESVAMDGSRIVVTGRANLTPDAGAATDMLVARYLDSGALDSTFSGGKVTVDLGGTIDHASSAVVHNGRVLIAGYAEATNYSQADFAIVGLLDDGSLDSSFGINGVTLTDFFGSIDYGWGGLGIQLDPLSGVPKVIHAGRVGPSPFRVGLARHFF